MNEALAEHFARPVTGPSYRPSARMMVAVTILGLTVWGIRTASEQALGWQGWTVLAAGVAAVLIAGWSVLAGKTTIDAQGIRQDGMPRKAFGWHEIVRVRRLRMPFTCRLLISTGKGPLKAIHAGNAELDRAFADIEAIHSPRP